MERRALSAREVLLMAARSSRGPASGRWDGTGPAWIGVCLAVREVGTSRVEVIIAPRAIERSDKARNSSYREYRGRGFNNGRVGGYCDEVMARELIAARLRTSSSVISSGEICHDPAE